MDATQQDAEVVEEVVEESVEEGQEELQEENVNRKVQGSREEMLERIVQDRESDVINELVEGTEGLEDYEEVHQDTEESPPVWKHEGQWVTQVKVHGQDVIVPFEGLKSSHQKDAASQQRFQQAAQKERVLAQQEAQLRQYAESLQQKQSAPPVQDEPEDGFDYNKTVEEYHQALYEDNAAKAAELLQTLTGRNTATPNIDEAVDKAVGQAFARRQAEQAKAQQIHYESEVKNAVGWFDQEYPDISQDTDLRAIADNKTVTLMKENPSWTPGQVIYAAAEYTRNWANPNNSNQPLTNERVERKKKIVPQPKSARKSAKISEDDTGPKTPEQVIEEMRQARGQM
tara:strand:- start:826 stop:1854 length:1029 start_codon:yes stop_codon:yes gene_type:complete